jgi:hypothetical protein
MIVAQTEEMLDPKPLWAFEFVRCESILGCCEMLSGAGDQDQPKQPRPTAVEGRKNFTLKP